MSIPLRGSSSGDQNLSEYELERLKNIREIQQEVGGLFLNVQESAGNLAKSTQLNTKRPQNSQQWTKRKLGKRTAPVEHIRRSARIISVKKKPTNYNEHSDSDNDENKPKKNRRGSLRIKFPFFQNAKYKEKDQEYYNALNDSDFFSDYDDYDNEPSSKKRHYSKSTPTTKLVSEITQDMLKNIHYSSCNKEYSSNGTTCHQCRQKTLDQKSYCRYKECRGSRGLFCGFCLGNRYGEDVAVVLLDKKWACPPCRGYCNCSICRRRQGKQPTGQMVQLATANGYKSVRHLLVNIEGEKLKELSDNEEDNKDISDVESEKLLNNFENKEDMDDNCKSEKTVNASPDKDNKTKTDNYSDNNIIVSVNTNCKLEEENYSLYKDSHSETSECSNNEERSVDFDTQTASVQSNSDYIDSGDESTHSTKSNLDSNMEEFESDTQHLDNKTKTIKCNAVGMSLDEETLGVQSDSCSSDGDGPPSTKTNSDHKDIFDSQTVIDNLYQKMFAYLHE